MKMTNPEHDCTTADSANTAKGVILLTDAALSDPAVPTLQAQGHAVVIAGNNPVALSLAALAMPEAARLLTNLNRSADIQALAARLALRGGVAALILAPNGPGANATLALLRLTLALLPGMRQAGRGDIRLIARDPAAYATLTAFCRKLGPAALVEGVRMTVVAKGGHGEAGLCAA